MDIIDSKGRSFNVLFFLGGEIAGGLESRLRSLLRFLSFLGLKREVILAAVRVDTVELGESAVWPDDLAVAEEAPDLSKGHGEAFL